MAKQKIEIEVGTVEGFEPTCEYRPPRCGEFYLDSVGAVRSTINFTSSRLILRRVKQYREPVLPADYGKQCEFSDDGEQWCIEGVSWWHPVSGWMSCGGEYWKHCRIEKESTA